MPRGISVVGRDEKPKYLSSDGRNLRSDAGSQLVLLYFGRYEPMAKDPGFALRSA